MSKQSTKVCSDVAQFEVLTSDFVERIDSIIQKKNNDPSRLVGIFLEIQDIIPKQYIPTEVAAYVSEKLDVPLSQVFDVISFYAALSPTPRADYIIQVCDSVVCQVVGNSTLKDTLESVVGVKIGEVREDGRFALYYSPCFGACDVAPAIRLNGKVYGHLTSEDKIRDIINSCV